MKITIIGAGHMGRAIAWGLAEGSIVSAKDITCTAQTFSTLQKVQMKGHRDIVALRDNVQAVQEADMVLLCVKPWAIEGVIREILPALKLEKQILLSVAAGITFDQLEAYLGTQSAALFRVIPNTAIEVKQSMTLVAARHASPEQTEQVLALFRELGQALLIDEARLEAATALASCGTALAMRYIRASVEAGVELGIRPDLAQELVAQTLKGAAELLQFHQSHPEEEIDKVTTPGGYTIRGLNAMEHAGFSSAVIQGLKACVAK